MAKKDVHVEKADDVQEGEVVEAKPVKVPKKKSKKNEVAVVPLPPHERTADVPASNPETLIKLAIEKNVSVDALEKLVALQERYEAREAKKAYDRSMAAFQAECPTITKTKVVHTKTGQEAYRYAPIESIVNQVKGILEKHGFSYSTSMELKEKGVKVAVKVVHELGHHEISEMEVPFGTQTAIMSNSQQAAAAQTFAKRYAFCNAFGILTGDADNDGATLETGKRAGDVPPAAVVPAKQPERVIEMDASESQEIPETYRCQEGGEEITEQEARYSVRFFGRPLCRVHQKGAKQSQ